MPAAPSNIQIQGTMQTAYGTIVVNITLPVAIPLGSVSIPTLASGFQNIAVPAGATIAIIQFSAANAVAVTLKGVTGDTGLLLNKTGTNILMLDVTQTTIGLTTGAIFTTPTTIQFF